MRKVISCILIIVTVINTFSGCDFKDLDRRALIVAIGIDEAEENSKLLKVSLKAAMPTNGGDAGGTASSAGSGASEIYTVTGESLAQIFREVKSQISMEPDFSHMKLIAFGESFAQKHKIDHIIDFFTRRRDFQNISWVSLGRPSAEAILSIRPKDERAPGNSLFMKFGQGTESPYAYDTRLYEMYSEVITPGCTPACSIIEAQGQKLIMNETAVFYKDKLALILNDEETELMNLLLNQTRLGALYTKLEDKDPPLAIGINNGNVKIDMHKDGSTEIICKVSIKLNTTLEEADNFSGNVDDIIPIFENSLKDKTMALLSKLKKNRVDPLNLQIKYWSKNKDYELSEKWLEDTYQKVSFQVDVKINMSEASMLGAH